MSEKIGYQDGIAGFVGFLKKFPLVKYRADRPADMAQWSWLEKLERTLRILKDAHDASVPTVPTDPPPPPPPPPPVVKRLAPQTYNKGSSGQDARYCLNSPGVTRISDTRWQDEGGYTYNVDGLCDGGRSGNPVAGLKPADEMDGREPCDPYTNGNQSFPPWPAASYEI